MFLRVVDIFSRKKLLLLRLSLPHVLHNFLFCDILRSICILHICTQCNLSHTNVNGSRLFLYPIIMYFVLAHSKIHFQKSIECVVGITLLCDCNNVFNCEINCDFNLTR